jgi:hypothetical protein
MVGNGFTGLPRYGTDFIQLQSGILTQSLPLVGFLESPIGLSPNFLLIGVCLLLSELCLTLTISKGHTSEP